MWAIDSAHSERTVAAPQIPESPLDPKSNLSPESPLGLAAVWSARIAAVAAEMVLPGLGGQWLDGRLGWSPALTVCGFAIGMIGGIWHLLIMTGARKSKTAAPKKQVDRP